jgi:hypothetical protein
LSKYCGGQGSLCVGCGENPEKIILKYLIKTKDNSSRNNNASGLTSNGSINIY